MLTTPLAPYLYWVKTRPTPRIDLAGSNLLACPIDELPGAREALDLTAADRNGYPPLVSAIAQHYGVGTDRVVTANGCSAANFMTIAALVSPGDDVLMESPWYDQITGACELLGTTVRHFDRRAERGFRVDIDAVRAALTPRTRLIIVTSPHNPSGAIVSTDALHALHALAVETNAHVIVDEVYLDAANLIQAGPDVSGPYDPGTAGHFPAAAGIGDRLISISSLTKSYGLAGLRCGWAIGAAPVIARVQRVRDLIDNIGAAPADRLSTLAFSQIGALAGRASGLLDANLAIAREFLAANPRIELDAPLQATIMFPRVAGSANTDALVQRLFDATGVGVAPGRFFGAPAHIRISLAGRTADLREGLACLTRVLAEG